MPVQERFMRWGTAASKPPSHRWNSEVAKIGPENSLARMERFGRTLTGFAIPYGIVVSPEFNTDFREKYEAGCFADSLQRVDDVRALMNGNQDKVLGRVSAGTLRVSDKPDGLYFEVDIPETSYGDGLIAAMARGDIDQCMPQCRVQGHRWEWVDGEKVLVIERGRLVVISIASFGLVRVSGEVDGERSRIPSSRLTSANGGSQKRWTGTEIRGEMRTQNIFGRNWRHQNV